MGVWYRLGMTPIEKQVSREAKAVTKQEIIVMAIEKRIKWIQAADILDVSPRHMLRLKNAYEEHGFGGMRDGRSGKTRRKRIRPKTISKILGLKRKKYGDFSTQHFYEQIVEKHGIKISYTWTLKVLQAAGLAEKAPARGKYRRARERRPMTGMLLHLDASTHEWIAGLPKRDLVVMMDDADGKILYARFVEEEGTASTLSALWDVLTRHGRFCELYTDRGSHFCRTEKAGEGPADAQNGQVSRALAALGIRQILARSPQARGRSERAFGTIQGRLPQELRVAGTADYDAANAYLEKVFVPDFNRRFSVPPAETASAFVRLVGIDLRLLLSIQHERVVRNDSTVAFEKTVLQLPRVGDRHHYVRCPVQVHELIDGTIGVSFQGKLLAQYNRLGDLLSATPAVPKRKAGRP